MPDHSYSRIPRTLTRIAIATSLLTTACSGDSDSPAEQAQAQGSLTRGPDDFAFNQGWRVDQHVRMVRDLTGDGLADIIGFGNDGVYTSTNQGITGFTAPTRILTAFSNNLGFNNTNSIRTLADVNGDHLPDIVVIGPSNVQVSLATATGYAAPTVWSSDFAGWDVTQNVFQLADVDADGRADLIGIDSWGVYVARALPSNVFEPKTMWVRAFNARDGWDITKHPRMAVDINNDGRADIVGFGNDGTWATLSTGTSFGGYIEVSTDFGYNQGWRIGQHQRVFVNVDGDRFVDLVGIGDHAVMVAHGGAAGFGAATQWTTDFVSDAGWTANHPRLFGDVDGDGKVDLVGMKDSQVFFARSTGTAFAAAQAVLTNEFTVSAGWDVAKHPRFLADVDGDHRLELVGFLDDSMWWDRLTPVEAPLPSGWDTPACAASRLGQPTPTTCEGPWQYTQTQRCVGVDNACPTYCSSFNACPLWENGAVASGTTVVGTGIVGPDLQHCRKTCRSGSCQAPTCSGTITQPTGSCVAQASSVAGQLRAQVHDAVIAEQNFDSAAAQNQRVAEAQAKVSVTPSYPIRTLNFQVTQGPGGLSIQDWDQQYGCNLSEVTASPVTAPNDACSCAVSAHSSCEHDCGTTTAYTAPDQERPTSPYISGQICMTHDDMPQTTTADIQAKFDALWTTYQGTPASGIDVETFKRAMVTRLKLLYELFGDKLLDQHTATDQVRRAISLYKDRPNDNPACSLDIDAPATPAGCTNPAVAGTHGDLIRCQRLLGSHASESVASLAEADCTALLTGYLGLESLTADDVTCGGPHLREVGASALFKLEDKQLGVINSAPATLGALPRQLWLLDGWYTASKAADAAGVFAAPDQQRRDTSFLIGEFWSRLRANTTADAQLTAASQALTPDQAESALGLSAGASRASEQSVVSALFTVPPTIQPENVTLTRPPLRSLPLLAILGDALKPFIDDLDGLALYHDIACQFRDCRAPATDTPSRSAWKLLSELEATTLANDVTQNTHALAGWNAVLAQLAQRQSTLIQAIGDAINDPGGGGLVDAKNEADVHPLARPLWLVFRHARAFHDHYETTGLFEPSAQNQLHGSLLSQDQHTVATGLRVRVAGLDTMVTTYRNGLIAALQAEIAVMDSGAQLTNLTDQRLHKAEEMNQKGQNLEGLRAAGEDEDAAFGNLAESFADIQHALDTGAFVQVGDTANVTVNGRSGKFTGGSQSLADLAVQTVPNLAAGQMLLLQTSGSWTPTCSLSEFSFLGAGGDNPQPADLSSAEIGPEGYTITNSGGTATASSTGHSNSLEASAGASFKYCESSGIAKVAGIEAEACVFAEVKGTMAISNSDSQSDDHRSSASFNSGIRLPNTPFPKAPTGSLLVVLVDPTTGTVNDVRVVHSGGTSILIEGPSTAYIIANDKSCTTSGNTHALNVSYRTVLSQTAVADKALQGMADVLAYMHQQRQTWVDQGTLLPSQAALLRQQANLLLQHRLDEIDVASLPGPLASLFDAFVSHQIVATERQIDITAIERSLQLDAIELRTIDDEFAAGAAHARLQRLVPQWIVRDLDHDTLRHNLVDVLSVSRDFLKPILELWYPTALQGLSDSPEITAMVNADVDSSLVTLAGNGSRFVTALLNAYDNGTFGSKPPGQVLPVVVLNFPRPGSDFTDSFWRQADATRARAVWDAIDRHTVAHFEISPEDFYSKNGGDAVLACTEVVPLIKSMELYVVRPGAGPGNDTLNTLQRTFQGFAGVSQSFVTSEGPRLYELADGAWQSFTLPVRYGEDEAAVQTFNATPRQARPVGLSASGAFDVDFSILDTLPHDGEFSDGQGFPVTGVQLVLELDSRAVASSAAPTWVDRCK